MWQVWTVVGWVGIDGAVGTQRRSKVRLPLSQPSFATDSMLYLTVVSRVPRGNV